MTALLIVDTGVILAAADNGDPHHDRCARVLEYEPGPLVTTPLVVAEACYLIDRQLGPDAETRFLRSIADGEIEVSELRSEDWRRMETLTGQYRDLPLGGTDASVIALAERLGVRRLATLDHRHFGVVKPDHLGYLELLP